MPQNDSLFHLYPILENLKDKIANIEKVPVSVPIHQEKVVDEFVKTSPLKSNHKSFQLNESDSESEINYMSKLHPFPSPPSKLLRARASVMNSTPSVRPNDDSTLSTLKMRNLNDTLSPIESYEEPKRRGRPKGSKNKPKDTSAFNMFSLSSPKIYPM